MKFNQPINSEPTELQSKLGWLMHGNRPALIVLSLFITGIIAIVVASNLPEQEMCLLFDNYQPTNAEQYRILAALGTTELKDYCEENGRILVPVSRKAEYLAAIDEKGAIPETLLPQPEYCPNLFMTGKQAEQQRLAQKIKTVSERIKQFPFVSDAQLEFDREESVDFLQPNKQTAGVMVTPNKNQILNRQQLETIQHTIASSFAGIQAHEVAVIDTNAGIAYGDIRQKDQSNLIEFENWKLERQKYYQKLLYTELNPEFPGIEVTVHVAATFRQAKQGQGLDRKSVFKLASEISQFPQPLANSKVGLNTTQTITVSPPKVARPHSEVANASFEAMLPHATKEVRMLADSAPESYDEKLSIQIVVPNSLLDSNESQEPPRSPAEQFDELRRQIAAKVRSRLPEEILTEAFPIEIAPRNCLDSTCAGLKPTIDFSVIKKFWPLWAVLLTSIFAAVLIRNQNRSVQTTARSNAPRPETEMDLEIQLSELIEKDPTTAAKVLKNWIQQEH